MKYEDWEQEVPSTIKNDSVWKMVAYRLALFAADLGWYDVTKLVQDRRTIGLSDQLYRALGSVSANVIEGYSRGTGKDRARFYEYALGSARESRDWYYKGRHILGKFVTEHRLELLTEVIRLLLTMIPEQRNRTIRESETMYKISRDDLLTNAPFP
ncbi:MAG: four helix bundle protein [Candidatus Poribacteria bacterium]|nr:four helix bundle protein [Candidatus Poribacteria bacterium]